jgi:hypothetical protein
MCVTHCIIALMPWAGSGPASAMIGIVLLAAILQALLAFSRNAGAVKCNPEKFSDGMQCLPRRAVSLQEHPRNIRIPPFSGVSCRPCIIALPGNMQHMLI